MKTIKTLFSAATLLFLCACGSKPYPQTMQVADSLATTNPDSALVLLKQLKDNINTEPEAVRMYYQLLTIKVKDKAYIEHVSDSVIREVVNYYENRRDKKHLPEAYYYAGRVYRDLGDAPQALEYFQKSIDSSKESTDYRLISLTYNQTAMLYLYQGIYKESLSGFKKAFHYAELLGDSALMVYNLRDTGRAFTGMNHTDSTLYYYKKAELYAREINNMYLVGIINQEVADIYTQLKEYDNAHAAIQSSALCAPQRNYAAYCAVLADLYYETGQVDSARYYYVQQLSNGNCYHKQSGYRGLSKIARRQGKFVEAFEYMDQYLTYKDSIHKMNNTEAVHKVNALYSYRLREKENYRLENIARQQKSWIIILVISIMAAAVIVTGVYINYQQRRRRRQIEMEQLQERLKNIAQEQYRNSQQFITENEKRIEEMNIRLQDAKYQKDELSRSLQESEKELLELTTKQVEIKQKIQVMSEAMFKESQIYKDFHHVSKASGFKDASEKKTITSADWRTLTTALNQTYNNFTQRLRIFHPSISEQELRICILIKIDISPTGIAMLTARSKQAVTSARKMLYEKTHNQQGTPDLWDEFIIDF